MMSYSKFIVQSKESQNHPWSKLFMPPCLLGLLRAFFVRQEKIKRNVPLC